jgi:uncharacterized protein involved in tolerance to divalent cations
MKLKYPSFTIKPMPGGMYKLYSKKIGYVVLAKTRAACIEMFIKHVESFYSNEHKTQ